MVKKKASTYTPQISMALDCKNTSTHANTWAHTKKNTNEKIPSSPSPQTLTASSDGDLVHGLKKKGDSSKAIIKRTAGSPSKDAIEVEV